jgi:hypothetical protein
LLFALHRVTVYVDKSFNVVSVDVEISGRAAVALERSRHHGANMGREAPLSAPKECMRLLAARSARIRAARPNDAPSHLAERGEDGTGSPLGRRSWLGPDPGDRIAETGRAGSVS